MDTPTARSPASALFALFSLVLLLLALAHAGSSEAGVVRQITNRRTTRIAGSTTAYAVAAASLDDAGTTVFVNSCTNQLGGNPDHRFQIFRFDAVTGAGQQVTSFPKGVSDLPGTVSVSDDGQWLAFVSRSDPVGQNHDASPEVFVMRPDGSGLAQRTSDPAVNAGSVTAVALSGSANRIAFLSNSNPLGTNPGGRVQLFIVNFDGSGVRQLTTDAATNVVYWYGVSISDDGQRVVFSTTANLTGGNVDGGTEVYAVQADGSNLRQLTSAPSGIDSQLVVISGNGAKIAFESTGNLTGQNADGSFEIFVINWDGTGMRQLTSSSVDSYGPSITDDGQFVFFPFISTGPPNLEISRIKSDGTGFTPLTSGSYPLSLDHPVVAGGGGRIAFLGNDPATPYEPGGLYVMTGTGTNVRQLEAAAVSQSESSEITRDGTRIVFTSNANPFGTNPDGGYEIFRIEADGTGLAQVTHLELEDAYDPSIAADGTTIVFSSEADPTGQNGDGSREIFRIHADGTGLLQLTNFMGVDCNEPRISANGAAVVFWARDNTTNFTEIVRTSPDGTGLTYLTSGHVPQTYSPRVDDTGTWVTFYSAGNLNGTNPNGRLQIWRIRSDGTNLRRVSTDNTRYDSYPDISGSGERIVYLSNADPLGTNATHRYEVFLYDATTLATRQLTFTPAPTGSASAPSISGDGSLVYFSATAPYDESDPDSPYNLYRVPAMSGPVERIGALAPSALSGVHAPHPDMAGSRIVFDGGYENDTTEQNPDDSDEIWLIDMTKDPEIRVSRSTPTLVSWDYEAGPIRYDVIRGDVAGLRPGPAGTVDLGPVACLENDSPDADTSGFEDPVQPPVGHAFFFVFRGSRGLNYGPGSWGQSSSGHERVPGAGTCPP